MQISTSAERAQTGNGTTPGTVINARTTKGTTSLLFTGRRSARAPRTARRTMTMVINSKQPKTTRQTVSATPQLYRERSRRTIIAHSSWSWSTGHYVRPP